MLQKVLAGSSLQKILTNEVVQNGLMRAGVGAAAGALAGGVMGFVTSDRGERISDIAGGVFRGALIGGGIGAAAPRLAASTNRIIANLPKYFPM